MLESTNQFADESEDFLGDTFQTVGDAVVGATPGIVDRLIRQATGTPARQTSNNFLATANNTDLLMFGGLLWMIASSK